MGQIVEFEGTVAEYKKAQDWCGMLEGRWDSQPSGGREYKFWFQRGDEAAWFRDRHC